MLTGMCRLARVVPQAPTELHQPIEEDSDAAYYRLTRACAAIAYWSRADAGEGAHARCSLSTH